MVYAQTSDGELAEVTYSDPIDPELRRCTHCGGQDDYPKASPYHAPCTRCEDFVLLVRVPDSMRRPRRAAA